MHGKISLLLYDYQTQLKTPFNRTCPPVLFAEFNISKFCALNNLTLAKAVDDTDRKSRHQTDRSPFILRVQKKTIKQVTNGGKGASKSNRKCCGVLFCVKLETKDKSSLFELILTKFFLLCEH